MSAPPLWQFCAVALADAFRGDGEILASPMGTLPTLGARLAKLTFAPQLLLSDGVASLMAETPALGAEPEALIEGALPYRAVFDVVWSGRRHVLMGASQIDVFGNQNISCLGDPKRPKVQLLGVRGAPGNTINHTTSYWVPLHTRRTFVERVDVVCGVGYDRAAKLGEVAARFHEIRRVVSNLGVFDFESADHRMRVRSLHPGVTLEEVQENTGFELAVAPELTHTRNPTEEEAAHLGRLDPKERGAREVPNRESGT